MLECFSNESLADILAWITKYSKNSKVHGVHMKFIVDYKTLQEIC